MLALREGGAHQQQEGARAILAAQGGLSYQTHEGAAVGAPLFRHKVREGEGDNRPVGPIAIAVGVLDFIDHATDGRGLALYTLKGDELKPQAIGSRSNDGYLKDLVSGRRVEHTFVHQLPYGEDFL